MDTESIRCKLCLLQQTIPDELKEGSSENQEAIEAIFNSKIQIDADEIFFLCYSCASSLDSCYAFYTEVLLYQAGNSEDWGSSTASVVDGVLELMDDDDSQEVKIELPEDPEVYIEEIVINRKNPTNEKEEHPKQHANHLVFKYNEQIIKKHFGLVCNKCGLESNTLVEYKDHMENFHGEEDVTLSCCDFTFRVDRRDPIVDHAMVHMNPSSLTCMICGYRCLSRGRFTFHMQKHNPKPNVNLTCTKCGKLCLTPKALEAHELAHLSWQEKEILRTIPCPQCDKMFYHELNLKAHIKHIHVLVPDHVCDICGKSYKKAGQLNTHMRTAHETPKTPEQPVTCQECGKILKNINNLKCHMNRVHAETTEDCKHCGKTYQNRNSLFAHIRHMHSQRPLLKCDTCGKSFKMKKRLMEHMASHTGIPLYTCNFCDRRFNSNANMYSHRKKMHVEEWSAYMATKYDTTGLQTEERDEKFVI